MLFLIIFVFVFTFVIAFLISKILRRKRLKNTNRTFRRKIILRRREIDAPDKVLHCRRFRKKPKWVTSEVIRLKALSNELSCRSIAETFNRQNRHTKNMTVGKTFVADTLKNNQYAVQVLRKKLKHKKPAAIPKNTIWATDLTTITDEQGKQNKVIGIIDHGTRACLRLQTIKTKHSLVLIHELFTAINLYGKPKILRTDNKAVFTSRLFRLALKLLNIKHQKSDKYCPWQNGRIERFFGTLKQITHQIQFECQSQLEASLPEFRFWYNQVRTHHNIDHYTPAEKWDGIAKKTHQPLWFETWDGVLTGYYFRE